MMFFTREEGVTLVEVLIASIILFIAVIGSSYMFFMGSKNLHILRQKNAARLYLGGFMEHYISETDYVDDPGFDTLYEQIANNTSIFQAGNWPRNNEVFYQKGSTQYTGTMNLTWTLKDDAMDGVSGDNDYYLIVLSMVWGSNPSYSIEFRKRAYRFDGN